MLLFFKLIDYLLGAVALTSVFVIYVDSDNQQYMTAASVALTVAIGLFLLNRQSVKNARKEAQKNELSRKAELYTSLLSNGTTLDYDTVLPARAKALEYCQELINDYKSSRNLARTLYYVLQISTVILSGVTPILVLVDKLETGQPWLKWLPVICPAVASIVASIVTSFPFQKNWVAANKAVELLEAEQEKFILGITPAYRCYNISEEGRQQQKVSQAIEQFITQVNNIHLQQIQQNSETEQENKDKQEGGKPGESSTPSTGEQKSPV
ncbi:MAG: DUF4231 domain-containing protein [Cuspidothrix sp.]